MPIKVFINEKEKWITPETKFIKLELEENILKFEVDRNFLHFNL